MTDLADRIERDGVKRHAEEVWALCFREPDKGPWYWPGKKWKAWAYYEFWFQKQLREGDWVWSLSLVYPKGLPELIHSDRDKAFAAAIRARMSDGR